jgi:hypothetical protein
MEATGDDAYVSELEALLKPEQHEGGMVGISRSVPVGSV